MLIYDVNFGRSPSSSFAHPSNVSLCALTFDTFQLENGHLSDTQPWKVLLMYSTFDTSQLLRFASSILHLLNIEFMSYTFDTSHPDKPLPSNFSHPMNILDIETMLEVSHSSKKELKLTHPMNMSSTASTFDTFYLIIFLKQLFIFIFKFICKLTSQNKRFCH